MKVFKVGKVAVVLQGRFAGRKAVVLRANDNGTKERPYPHALVAGIQTYPRKITSKMTKRRMELRSRIKTFVKSVNYNHLMPTRYSFDAESASGVELPESKEPTKLAQNKKVLRKRFEERFKAGKNAWFFKKLRF